MVAYLLVVFLVDGKSVVYLFVVFLVNRYNCCLSACCLSCEQAIAAYLFVIFLVNR